MKRSFTLFLLLAALASSGRSIAQTSHDGDWWRGLSLTTRQNVVTGFLDGMALGHNLSLMGAGNSSDADCRTNIAQSYSYVRNRYFRNVTAGDLVSALDQIYSESDNGSIIFGRAVWIAVNRLAGTNPDEIQKLILQSRGMGE
jgi:hypothetical protein